MKKAETVEIMIVLAQFKDGSVRQVMLSRDECFLIESTIAVIHGGRVKVSSEILHGVSVEIPEKGKKIKEGA